MREPQEEKCSAIDAPLTSACWLAYERTQPKAMYILRELKCGGAISRVDQDEDPSVETLAGWFNDIPVRIVMVAAELQIPHACGCSRPWFRKFDGRVSPVAEALVPCIEIRNKVIGNLAVS